MANCHHRNLNAEDYECLDNEDDFVMINSQTHDCLHWLYRYYVNDPNILIRIKEELDRWHT